MITLRKNISMYIGQLHNDPIFLLRRKSAMLNKIHTVMAVAVGFLLAALLLLALTLHMDTADTVFEDNAINYNIGWLDEQGNETAMLGIASPEGSTVSFHRMLDGSELDDKCLCFISHNIVFSVYVDDMLIYDFDPVLGGYYGKSYGNYIHTVTLPEFSDTRTLSINGTVLIVSDSTGFEYMALQNSGAYIKGIAKENMWKFTICILTFGFGVILFFLGLVEHIRNGDAAETVYLGVITMMLSLWTNSSIVLLQIFTGNSAALRIIDYAVLCLLPIPVLIFVAYFTQNRKNRLL